jgi:membrane protein DedA with SNARE-associated domain
MSALAAGGPLVYLGIGVAAAVEGEVAFVAASTLVATGSLDAMSVLLVGALGAAIGDQFYFYAFRGRLQEWVCRWRPIAVRQACIVARVRRHQNLMALACRFSPGLRIAIAAACAFSAMPAWRFSLLDSIGALIWAALLLALIARAGPAGLGHLGVSGPWAIALSAMLWLAFIWWLSRRTSESVA